MGAKSTDTHQRVLEFIQEFQIAYPGMSPSYQEIIEALGLSSKGSMKFMIDRLSYDGHIMPYEHGASRGIVLSDTVLITKEQAEKMGIDFEELRKIQSKAKISVDLKLSRTQQTISYVQGNNYQVRRVFTP